jgi:stage II sporulation protein AA (anti-sigma F factor antagonist)
MTEDRRLRLREHGDVLILGFRDGQLTADLAVSVGKELSAAAAREEFKKVLLDFSGVEFVCSDVLAKVVILNKRLRQKEGRLKLCAVCRNIREILAITRLDTILDIVENERDALLAFA